MYEIRFGNKSIGVRRRSVAVTNYYRLIHFIARHNLPWAVSLMEDGKLIEQRRK